MRREKGFFDYTLIEARRADDCFESRKTYRLSKQTSFHAREASPSHNFFLRALGTYRVVTVIAICRFAALVLNWLPIKYRLLLKMIKIDFFIIPVNFHH